MPKIPLFFLIILFVVWLGYEIKKGNRDSKKASEDFWKKEHEAFLTPRKSIDDIRFIVIPDEIIPSALECLPEGFDNTDNEGEDNLCELNAMIDELRKLSASKIADLSAYTNTELRLRYGAPNFTELSNADTAFTRLLRLIPKLVECLREFGLDDDAKKLLDFCDQNGITSKKIRALQNH